MVADVDEAQRQIKIYEKRSMSLDGAGWFGGDIHDADGWFGGSNHHADVDMAEEQEEETVQSGELTNDNRVNSSDTMKGQQDIDLDVMTESRHPQTARSHDERIQLMKPIVQILAYCAPNESDGLEIQRMALARKINWLSDEAEMEAGGCGEDAASRDN